VTNAVDTMIGSKYNYIRVLICVELIKWSIASNLKRGKDSSWTAAPEEETNKNRSNGEAASY
jgi:hypothetical protein